MRATPKAVAETSEPADEDAGGPPPTGDAGGRRLVDAVSGLPPELVARATTPEDVEAITELERAVELAAWGHTSTAAEEVREELADPACGWGYGSACVWDGPRLVAASLTFDRFASIRGFFIDVYVQPGEERSRALYRALAASALREGQERIELAGGDPDEPGQQAKLGCFATEIVFHEELMDLGFEQVRRFQQMRVDHEPSVRTATPPGTPAWQRAGYIVRTAREDEADRRGIHAAHSVAFADHFDFTVVSFEQWLQDHAGPSEDPSQWVVADLDGHVVGYALGSNRYAAEGSGYVASLGVLPGHRGLGIARAMLLERFADDVRRGRSATMLHVDATNTTGANELYASVGMHVDLEILTFMRRLNR